MNVILSICIPTYNRLDKLKKQIENLLSVQDNRFNIVVSDNDSSDGTCEFLESLQDERVSVVKQKCVAATRNISNSLLNATGKFALLLLDKDKLDCHLLVDLLNDLECTNASFGYCSIVEQQASSRISYYTCSKNNFINFSYSCKHPSGDFFKTEDLIFELQKCESLINKSFPFIYAIMMAHFSATGDCLIVNYPIVRTETETEAASQKSYTFGVHNLWFSPSKVAQRYMCFLEDLEGLKIPLSWKNIKRKDLLRMAFRSGSIGYGYTMNNEKICQHYGIKPRVLSKKELLQCSKEIYNIFKKERISRLLLRLSLVENTLRILFKFK